MVSKQKRQVSGSAATTLAQGAWGLQLFLRFHQEGKSGLAWHENQGGESLHSSRLQHAVPLPVRFPAPAPPTWLPVRLQRTGPCGTGTPDSSPGGAVPPATQPATRPCAAGGLRPDATSPRPPYNQGPTAHFARNRGGEESICYQLSRESDLARHICQGGFGVWIGRGKRLALGLFTAANSENHGAPLLM